MPAPHITLRKPDPSFKNSFLAGLDEMTTDSDRLSWIYMGDDAPLDLPKNQFEKFVQDLNAREADIPKEGWVRDTTYWAVSGNNEVVGRIAIRHELNDFLKKAGGHIGYIVRPSWRKKGVATEMLRILLLTKRAQSIGKILVTCDDGNIASEKTIITNGGVLENKIEISPTKPLKKRFWIQIT
jgi:predicted acetyltransferase